MQNYVKFLRGTPTAFANLENKDHDTLYFISEFGSDCGSLYLGDKLIAGTDKTITEQVSENLRLTDLKDVTINTALADGDIIAYDLKTNQWINKQGINAGLLEKLNDLIADDSGKSIREIAEEVIKNALIPDDAGEELDTLQEIANWIQNGGTTIEAKIEWENF